MLDTDDGGMLWVDTEYYAPQWIHWMMGVDMDSGGRVEGVIVPNLG